MALAKDNLSRAEITPGMPIREKTMPIALAKSYSIFISVNILPKTSYISIPLSENTPRNSLWVSLIEARASCSLLNVLL